jgi:hypothetical protein
VRISIDTKATVAVGDYSRGGTSRELEAVKALDHDMGTKTKLVPVGILEVEANHLDLTFSTSNKTSDLIVDCLHEWWQGSKDRHVGIEELVIDSDNGPESNGQRTQFLKRMIEFVDATRVRVHLVYYPPYHSKYNPVERCWGILEKHWNGTLLSTISTTLEWAKTMTWRGIAPAVRLSTTVYAKGVRVSKQAMAALESRLQRSPTLPRWDIVIEPLPSESEV